MIILVLIVCSAVAYKSDGIYNAKIWNDPLKSSTFWNIYSAVYKFIDFKWSDFLTLLNLSIFIAR